MFKKFLWFAAAGVLIVVGPIAFFILTFDADRYRPEIQKQLESTLGSPARIGHLALGWNNGIVLEVKDLAIYRDRASLDKPAVYLERAGVKVRLMPLLSKEIEVASVTLVRPRLNVIKEAGGSLKVYGINPPVPSAPALSPSKKTSMKRAALTIGMIKIEDAAVGFVDNTSSPPMRIAVRRLDFLIKNVSLGKLTDFQAKMALFNSAQNVQLKGRIRVTSLNGPYLLENFRVDTDLGTVKVQELTSSIPAVQKAGLVGNLLGKVSGEVSRLKIDAAGMSDLDADFNLKEGKVAVESLRSPLAELNLTAHFAKSQMQLKNLAANFARGKIAGSSVSKNYLSSSPESTVSIRVDHVHLEDLLPPSRPNQPEVHGNFSASFDGRANGISWSAISRTLNGSGEVGLSNGLIVNGNILRKVFEGLSKIPGVSEALNSRLPEKYRQSLAQRDTAIPPIEFPVTLVNGIILIPNLQIPFEGFTLYGAGQVGLSGTINSQATLVLDDELSQVLIGSVPTMQYIADPYGKLSFPVRISGTTQNLIVEPDMDYVFSRVMATKGQELITNALQKALNKNQPSQAVADSSGTAAGGTSYEQILGKLLQ